MESHLRTVAKSLTWRVAAFGITTSVAWLICGRMEVGLSIGAVDTVIKLFAYYTHERAWLKVPFGRMTSPEYEI